MGGRETHLAWVRHRGACACRETCEGVKATISEHWLNMDCFFCREKVRSSRKAWLGNDVQNHQHVDLLFTCLLYLLCSAWLARLDFLLDALLRVALLDSILCCFILPCSILHWLALSCVAMACRHVFLFLSVILASLHLFRLSLLCFVLRCVASNGFASLCFA